MPQDVLGSTGRAVSLYPRFWITTYDLSRWREVDYHWPDVATPVQEDEHGGKHCNLLSTPYCEERGS